MGSLDQQSPSVILLDKESLEKQLAPLKTPFQLTIFSSIDSTNRYLKNLPIDQYMHICCAETQTQGRGRFGRYWHSPYAENIYCSSRWPISSSNLSGLSLVVSLALIDVLQSLGIEDLEIKWPNDLLWRTKKLSGILIEILENTLVIGIGINVNSNTLDNPLPDRLWCSLFEISGKYFDRNVIIALLILKLEQYLEQFNHHGFAAFMEQWQQYDCLKGKIIKINQTSSTISGTCLGVNLTGELIIEDEQKNIHYLGSGEASFSANIA